MGLPARQAFRRIFTVDGAYQKQPFPVPSRSGIAETRAPPAFRAKLLFPDAQNPVTLLWTACTRLKTQ
jgi:hypothetical protein